MANTKFKITTTANSQSVSFEIWSVGKTSYASYNNASVTINWGDNDTTSDSNVPKKSTSNSKTFSHTYNASGTYEIEINVISGYIAFASAPTALYTSTDIHLLEVYIGDNFRELPIQAFAQAPNLQSVTITSCYTMGTKAFYQCPNLTNVTLADSGLYGTSIYSGLFTGSSAFEGCTSITSVQIIGNVDLASKTFYGCTALETVTVSNGSDPSYEYHIFIRNDTFTNCTNLTQFTATSNYVLECKYPYGSSGGAFNNCTKLKSVTGKSIKPEGHSVFEGCTELTSVPMIEGTVGARAFKDCTKLVIDTVKYAGNTGEYAFAGCTIADLEIEFNRTVGSYAFYGCNITDTFDLSVAGEIRDHAFDNCNISGSVNLKNCSSIGDYAFNGCAITDLILSQYLTEFNTVAFDNMSFDSITLYAKIPPTISGESSVSATTVYVPQDAFEVYIDSNWNGAIGSIITALPDPVVPSGITPTVFVFTTTENNEKVVICGIDIAMVYNEETGNWEYMYDENSVFVDWGDGIVDIEEYDNDGGYGYSYWGEHCFVSPGDHVVKLYVTAGAFDYGTKDGAVTTPNISSISLGNDIVSIDEYAFNQPNGEKPKIDLTIGSDVTQLHQYAFYNAVFDTLVIPSNVTTLECVYDEEYGGYGPFSGITADAIIIEGTKDILNGAFSDVSANTIVLTANTYPVFEDHWAEFNSEWVTEHGPVMIVCNTDMRDVIEATSVDPTTYTISTFDPSAITPDEFVFSTTDENEEIFLEFSTNSYYSDTSIVDISWGDGTNSTVAVDLNDTPLHVTHNYSAIGNHTVHVCVLSGTAIMDHHDDDPAVSSNITSATTAANSNLILGKQALSYVTLESVTLNNENYDISTIEGGWNGPFCSSIVYNLDITNITNIQLGLFQHIHPATFNFIIPNNIISISDAAFEQMMGYNSEHVNVIIPDSVTSFGKGVFCSAYIDTVTFGKGITQIPEDTFKWSKTNSIIFTSEAAPIFENGWANFDSSYISTHGPVIITVPNKSIGAYTAAITTSDADPNSYVITSARDKSDVTPTKFTFTTTSANENSVINLTSVGSKATVIVNWGDNAADETVNLTDAETTEISHEYTNEGTYDACVYPTDGSVKLSKIASNSNTCAVSENLTALATGQYISTIDDDAVHGTNSIQLSNVDLNGDLTTLGDRAFYGSTINKLSIGNNVTTMGECALAVNMDSLIIPSTITVLTEDVLNDSNIDSITLNSTITEIDEGALVTSSCNDLHIKSQTPPTMAANSLKLSDGAVIHVPYGTTDAYRAVIEAADADPGNWTYTIEELPDPNRDPDEYDPDSIEDVPGSPAPEQNMSGDALKSILKAYGKNLKFIKTENNTISVNHMVRGIPYISSDDLIIRSFNGYDFVEVKSYDSYFRNEYISLIRVNDIRTFVIAKNARDQIDAFRC